MKVKAPAEKNFRRARAVKPARKRAVVSWKSWRVVVAVAACVVGLYATYQAFDLVLHASALQVHRIVVRGHVRLSSGEVQSLVDGLRGSNILIADLAKYRDRLRNSPWVADVAMRRVLPSTIEVFVSERDPVALCRYDGQLYLVDRDGTLIDEFGPRYIQFDVSDLRDAIVLLDDDPALLHLGATKFAERLQGYIDLSERLRETVPEIDYADLQFDGRIYVKPAGSAAMRSVNSPVRKN